jgi:DNA-binding transcriptional LysR family regulator
MHNLNDLYVFSQVVDHNGFTGAAHALGIARSSISRRVGQLEEELGVRLVQRSTRHFAVTTLGMELHAHCLKMVAEAKIVYDKVACAKVNPSGLVRVVCPSIVAQLLVSPVIPDFIAKHPDIRLAIEATNRRISIEDQFDVCITVRQLLSEDSDMIMRSLGIVQPVLVASPEFVTRHGRPTSPAAAAELPIVNFGSVQGPHVWRLLDKDGQELHIRLEPKFVADDMLLVRQIALQGLAIAQLPLPLCLNEIKRGLLEILLPEYSAPLFEIQLLFPSRQGVLPAVRSFIDFLASRCVNEVADWQIKRHPDPGHRDRNTSRASLLPLEGQAALLANVDRAACLT